MRKVTFLDWILEYGKMMMMMMSKRNSNQSRAKTYLRFEKQNSLLLASLLRPQKCLSTRCCFSTRSVSRFWTSFLVALSRTYTIPHNTDLKERGESLKTYVFEIFFYLSPRPFLSYVWRMVKSQSALYFAALNSLWRKFFGTLPSTYVIVLTTFLYYE